MPSVAASTQPRRAFDAWNAAEAAARSAERDLHWRWATFYFLGGPAPSGAAQREVALLRAAAVMALTRAKEEAFLDGAAGGTSRWAKKSR